MWRPMGNLNVVRENTSGVRRDETGENVEECSFSRAIWTDDGGDSAQGKRQINLTQDVDPAIGLGKPAATKSYHSMTTLGRPKLRCPSSPRGRMTITAT